MALTQVALLLPSLFAAVNLTYPDNYTLITDEIGQPYVIEIDDSPLLQDDINAIKTDLDSVTFTLYTRANPTGDLLEPYDSVGLTFSNWDANRPTRIVTHGWRGHGQADSCILPRDAYLAVGDYNVIVVDWGVIAKSLLYNKVAKSVPIVAEYVAYFIDFLEMEGKLNGSTTKMVGHSLGGHVASLAAHMARSKIAEVAALDPAKPGFEYADENNRVHHTHAEHVQVIHTNAGLLGLKDAVGTSDFYPNGGTYQPGCPIYDIVGACAHQRSYQYFSESIQDPTGFPGTPTGLSGLLTIDHSVYMGGPTLDPDAHGTYNVKTGSEPPFALS